MKILGAQDATTSGSAINQDDGDDEADDDAVAHNRKEDEKENHEDGADLFLTEKLGTKLLDGTHRRFSVVTVEDDEDEEKHNSSEDSFGTDSSSGDSILDQSFDSDDMNESDRILQKQILKNYVQIFK